VEQRGGQVGDDLDSRLGEPFGGDLVGVQGEPCDTDVVVRFGWGSATRYTPWRCRSRSPVVVKRRVAGRDALLVGLGGREQAPLPGREVAQISMASEARTMLQRLHERKLMKIHLLVFEVQTCVQLRLGPTREASSRAGPSNREPVEVLAGIERARLRRRGRTSGGGHNTP